MNNDDLRQPYARYVTWALTIAIIVLSWVVFCVFLSSKAEARPIKKHRTHITKVEKAKPVVRTVKLVVVSPFDKMNEPVKYLINWPYVPSVTEQEIEKARVMLRASMERRSEQVATVKMTIKNDRKWEDFKRGLGLALISLGCMVSITYGKGAVRKKSSI